MNIKGITNFTVETFKMWMAFACVRVVTMMFKTSSAIFTWVQRALFQIYLT